MLLLSHTALDAAEVFAERLRIAIEQHAFVSDIHLTISLGVGEYTPDENEFELFQRIDRALYRAKLEGRNRVEVDRRAVVTPSTQSTQPVMSGAAHEGRRVLHPI